MNDDPDILRLDDMIVNAILNGRFYSRAIQQYSGIHELVQALKPRYPGRGLVQERLTALHEAGRIRWTNVYDGWRAKPFEFRL